MLKYFYLIKAELLLTKRVNQRWIVPLIVYVLLLFIFTLSLESNNKLNNFVDLGLGIFWLIFIVTSITTLDGLFKKDKTDGSLEILYLTNFSFKIIIFSKIISHWFINIVPLVCISPFILYFFNLTNVNYLVFWILLSISSLIIVLIGAIVTSLLITSSKKGLLSTLLLLPMYIPIILHSLLALNSFNVLELLDSSSFQVLIGFFLISLPLSFTVCSLGLKLSFNQ